jgi:hypothetical protein
MFAARADHVHALTTLGVAGTFGSASAVPVVTVDTYGRLTNVTTAQAAALTTNDIRGLSTIEGAALTTAGVVGLSAFAARADHSHKVATVYARTKTVGVDAATIQGCIDLITDASATNQAQVVVPPGYYVENLTLKPCVSVVASGANNGQISTVRIVGNATFTGGATAVDNTLQLVGLSFNTNHATLPALTVAASGGVTTLLLVQDCMVTSSNAALTAIGIKVGTNCSVRLVNVRTQGNTTAGQGGTHVDVDGGTFYAENWTTEFGTRALLLRGTNGALKPYGELKWCNILVSGANAIEITSATALLTMGWVSVGNLATTGNGINVAAGSVVGATQCVFAVQAGASNYVVTGAAGSYYYSLGNSYSNATGVSYETKIGASVTQFQYARSYDPASGDLTGSFPAPTLAAVTTAQSNVGSATAIPRLSIDAKGRVMALSTVAVSALTTAQLAGLSTATPAVLATAGSVGTSLFAARADHVHALATIGTPGTFGDSSVVPIITLDAFGRVAALTTTAISGGGGGVSLTTADAAPLGAVASAGVSNFAAHGDHVHPLPTAAQIGAIATTGTVKLSINTALNASAGLNLAPLAVAPTGPTAGDIWISGNQLQFQGSSLSITVPGTSSNNTMTGTNAFANRVTVGAGSGNALTVNANNAVSSAAIVTGSTGAGVPLMRVTQTSSGDALVVEDSANPDTTPFTINAVGRVGIGLSVATTETAALTVDAGGIKFADGSVQTAFLAALTTAQIAGLSTATPAVLATTGAVGASLFAARADHVHALTTLGVAGTFGSGSAVPVVTVDAFGRVASVTTAAVSSAGVTTTGLAPLDSPALTGTPTAPTASVGTNSTQIATTAFVQTNAGDKYKTTSSTTATVANGTQTFTVASGLSYTPTQDVTIVANVSNHMHGTVTSYSGTTLVVDVSQHTGSGTFSSWTINVGGVVSGGGASLTTEPAYALATAGVAGLSTEAARADHQHPIGGDVAPNGTSGNVTVQGVQNTQIVGNPYPGGMLGYDVSQSGIVWASPSGDVAQVGSGILNLEVQGIRGREVEATLPTVGDTYVWTGVRWAPQNLNVPTAGTANPSTVSTVAQVGTSTSFAREDHAHTLEFFSYTPEYLKATPSEGVSSYVARADHAHAIDGDVQPNPFQPNEIKIVRLQGKTVNAGNPSAGQILEYGSTGEWVPSDYKSYINAIVAFLNAPPYSAGLSYIP